MAYHQGAIPRKPSLKQEIPYVEHLLPKEVDKYGGSSTAEPHRVVEISKGKIKDGLRPLIVVSAAKGATDELTKLSDECFEEVKPLLEERIERTGTLLKRLEPFEKDPHPYLPSKKVLEHALFITSDTATVSEIVNVGYSSKIYNLMFPKDQQAGLKGQIFDYLTDLDHFVEAFFRTREKEIAARRGINSNKALRSDEDFKQWRREKERIDKETSALMLEEAKLYMRDKFVYWGEFPMSKIIAEALRSLGYKVCSSEPSNLGILTNMLSREIEFIPDFQLTFKRKFRELAQNEYDAYVLGGFIARGLVKLGLRTFDDKELMLRTTLGRGGSDLTAVASGGALSIQVYLYSDRDGVYACNPGIYPNKKTISVLSTDESIEFATYGSKILYVEAMKHAKQHNVQVTSLNTFNPSHPGTRIYNNPDTKDWQPQTVKGISFLNKGDYYTMAVIGHDIGNSPISLQVIQKMRQIHPLGEHHINTHSITFNLPKAFVQTNAERIYNAFC